MSRQSLRLITTLALLVSSFPLLAESGYTIEVPRTLHAKIIPKSNRAALNFAATHIGISWNGDEEAPPLIRMSRDAVSWSEWTEPPVAHDMEADETFYSGLIPGRDARFIQIQTSPQVTQPVIFGFNTRDGPKKTIRVTRRAEAATPQPQIISRAEWGADESLRKGTPSFSRVKRLFVHHTVTKNDDPDPAATIRALYSYHTQGRGWNDIGYNFLIDSSGQVYEGRWAGKQVPGENLNGSGVIGAHVSGYNTGSAGVALLGEFTGTMPREAAVDGLVSFLAWKADRHGIDPYGATSGIPNIAGHRDAGATACPGSVLYDHLPAIRDSVEQRIQQTTSLSAPSMPTGTELIPAGASGDMTPGAAGSVSRSAVRVELTFEGSTPDRIRRFEILASSGNYKLTDDQYGGLPLRTDTYRVSAVAFDAVGASSSEALVDASYLVSDERLPRGYWVLGSDGGVFSYGEAKFHGSTGGMRLNQPIRGMAATPSGGGYWLVASDGGIFAFGDAPFRGSTGSIKLNKPIVGMAATPSGDGYWLVASDGGIFAFGDAQFRGSTGSIKLNQPIVGMAATPSGDGYWLVASDGGIFAFGDAQFKGSTGSIKLNQPIVGMAASPSGGYWLVASDGGIFSFGDASYNGSLPGRNVKATAVGMGRTFTGKGYYIVSQGGGMYTFGDAPFYGSPSSSGLNITAQGASIIY